MTGVGAAGVQVRLVGSILSGLRDWAQSVFPLRRSRQSVRKFGLSKAVRKMRLSQITGDESPGGSATFHKTFDAGPK